MMKKIISMIIFLTSIFILAYSPACFAFSDNDSVYYLDSSMKNTIELWIEDQPWWDSNWEQRQQITISGSLRELSNYQTKIELNSKNVGKNWNWTNRGSDIRFVDDMNRKLNFYIESWSATNKTAKIWVKASSIPMAGTAIYMYYKNPRTVSESNGKNTFIFFDNFDRLKNWEHFTLDSENVIGSTIYSAKKSASRPYALKTALDLNGKNSATEGAQSPALALAQTNDELIIDMRYKTSGTIWQNNEKKVSLKISNFPIKSLDTVNKWHAFNSSIKYIPNSNNRWINASSSPFTALQQTYYYLRLNIDGVANTLTNVELDDIRVRKYAEQEPFVEISNWYGMPSEKVIMLDSNKQMGMLLNIGGEFEKMEKKKLEIEKIEQGEKTQEELEALEKEERERMQFQIQEITTQLYPIKKQVLGYRIGGNIRAPVDTSTVDIFGHSLDPSPPAQQAIDTAVASDQAKTVSRKIITSGRKIVATELARAGVELGSAGEALGRRNPTREDMASLRNAQKAITKATQTMRIVRTAVEIENRFADISNQAINTASYYIARQISSGGYSQSFTQQQIQSAVSNAISGQSGEIILEKLIETEVEGKMVISGKEILKITVKAVEKEINTITPQEILKDTKDIWSSSPFLDIGNCPFGCSSKPEIVSDKSIGAINDSNLVMQIEKQDNDLRAIRISKILGEETTYIPIIIDKYTVEDEKEILVIKIGTITEDDHGLTVKKIEIEINDTKEGAEIKLDVIPAIDIDEPLPIVIETPDNDYMPIYPSYVMTADEKKNLANSWEFNQEYGCYVARAGFDKFVDKTETNIGNYENEKNKAIADGFVILEEGVSPDGDPYFTAGIAHGRKTEMLKISAKLEGNIPLANTGLQYILKDTTQTKINLNDIASGNYEFEVSNANSHLQIARIVGDELILTPTNPDETYGTDYIDVWITDKTTGKRALSQIFIAKGESNTIKNPDETFSTEVNGEKANKVVIHFENFDIKLGDQLYVDGYRVKSVDDIPIWGPADNEIYVDKNGYTTPFTPVSNTVTVEKEGSGNSAFKIDSITSIEKPGNSGESFAMLISGTGRELEGNEEMRQVSDVLIKNGGYIEDNVFVSEDTYKKDFDNTVANLYGKVDNANNVNQVTLMFYNHGQVESMAGHIPWTETAAKDADKGIIGLCTERNGCYGMPPDPSVSGNDIKITTTQVANITRNLLNKGVDNVTVVFIACHSKPIGELFISHLSGSEQKKVTVVASTGDGVDYGNHMRKTSEGISSADGDIKEWADSDGPVNVVNLGINTNMYVESGFIEEDPSKNLDKTYTGSLRIGARP